MYTPSEEPIENSFEGLSADRVLHYFKEICAIPHGSYNVTAISNYLAEFGKSYGIETIQDTYENIIFKKPASPGMENHKPVILQGHMDMVAVHDPSVSIDMTTTGLSLETDGDWLYAKDTSLGGDDGIAVAMILALMEDQTYPFPPIEAIITTNEETGMEGATGIDLSSLKGNRLINLDSEDEGVFTVGCAGGCRAAIRMPLRAISPDSCGSLFKLTLSGLTGGHSGTEIHWGRANANILCGKLLSELLKVYPDMKVSDLHGGVADNAICPETHVQIFVPGLLETDEAGIQSFLSLVRLIEVSFKRDFANTDPDLVLKVERLLTDQVDGVSSSSNGPLKTGLYEAAPIAELLCRLPNGVQAMNPHVAGLVNTSLNLGILRIDSTTVPISFEENVSASAAPATLLAEFCIRSSVEADKEALIQHVGTIAEAFGADYSVHGSYPGWEYREESPLRDCMVSLFEKYYGYPPKVEAIHAGLECGILGSKIKDLDAVSIGPDMKDIHTFHERLSLSSVQRVWEYLVRLLEIL